MLNRSFLVIFILLTGRLSCSELKLVELPLQEKLILVELQESDIQDMTSRPHPLFAQLKKKQKASRRLTAALIAFPFPFGMVGLHRIYLGSAPYVPVVYIASLGGIFGLIPLIDCIVLLADQKNFEKYENSKKVFMWIE